MASQPRKYDLMLLLSAAATDEDRSKILSEVESTITSAGGAIERNQEWGVRPMTYRINHQNDAEYHLLQFTGPTSVLETLAHNLGIADAVLRYRIIKVLPGTPPAPESAPPVLAAAAATHPAASAASASASAEQSA